MHKPLILEMNAVEFAFNYWLDRGIHDTNLYLCFGLSVQEAFFRCTQQNDDLRFMTAVSQFSPARSHPNTVLKGVVGRHRLSTGDWQ